MVAVVLVVLGLLGSGALGQRLLADLRGIPSAPAPEPSPTVSVVVPARDEAGTLPLLLESLRRLQHPPHEVLVVDDASGDETARVARDGGAVVLAAGTRPPSWTGKAWACHRGAEASTGSVLAFLDADTVLAPDALDHLTALHARQGGLVSVQPYHRPVRAYEQLSAYFNVVSLMASGAFTGRPPSRPMAFGPCLLTARVDYQRAGGHAAVRSEVLDDSMLAAAYVEAGLGVHCAVGGRALWMRMYPHGWRQLTEGWTKNIASGAARADPWSSWGTGLWLAGHWMVAAAAALALAGTVAGVSAVGTNAPGVIWALAWVAVALQLRSILRRAGSFRWWTWALFPLPLLAFTVIFARSLLLTRVRGEVTWRGRGVRTQRAAAGRRRQP
jgi:4,4'-diaponeurosporenoate glycosyltransferase